MESASGLGSLSSLRLSAASALASRSCFLLPNMAAAARPTPKVAAVPSVLPPASALTLTLCLGSTTSSRAVVLLLMFAVASPCDIE